MAEMDSVPCVSKMIAVIIPAHIYLTFTITTKTFIMPGRAKDVGRGQKKKTGKGAAQACAHSRGGIGPCDRTTRLKEPQAPPATFQQTQFKDHAAFRSSL